MAAGQRRAEEILSLALGFVRNLPPLKYSQIFELIWLVISSFGYIQFILSFNNKLKLFDYPAEMKILKMQCLFI